MHHSRSNGTYELNPKIWPSSREDQKLQKPKRSRATLLPPLHCSLCSLQPIEGSCCNKVLLSFEEISSTI
jgi:hypothetical protein